jgi:hypothetical protein
MHNLLKLSILKDAETIQEVTIFMQKEAGISWFEFSSTAHIFWDGLKNFGSFLMESCRDALR